MTSKGTLQVTRDLTENESCFQAIFEQAAADVAQIRSSCQADDCKHGVKTA
ncbi:MAG: hypothetical protein K9N55_01895 [Phycisphaerae bacterium]|nr:hypothetical protein [Phycisphaerae bacterium]